MTIIDLKNGLTRATVSHIAARTSTLTTSGVDLQSYIGQVVIGQLVGTVSGTTPTLDGKIQSSADNSTWADVTGATYTQATASNDVQFIAVDTRLASRYVRYVGTVAGTSPSFTMGVQLLGQKQVQ